MALEVIFKPEYKAKELYLIRTPSMDQDLVNEGSFYVGGDSTLRIVEYLHRIKAIKSTEIEENPEENPEYVARYKLNGTGQGILELSRDEMFKVGLIRVAFTNCPNELIEDIKIIDRVFEQK